MMNLEEIKKGEKFWCWWMHRYLYFIRKFENRYTGVTYFVFEDVADVRFNLTEDQVLKLERRA